MDFQTRIDAVIDPMLGGDVDRAMTEKRTTPLEMPASDALAKHFGFDGFRDGQQEVIDQILEGRDGLVVMPTGGGKSLCFQIPALCLPGVTLVISPLIALMKDQVDGLVARGIPATLINSSLSWPEQQKRLDGVRRGEWKLVYIAPERFRAESFLRVVKELDVALFAVDEAHCVSQWGHDFRPDYMRLGQALEALGRPQCVAFTATATPTVREDILQVLKLREPFECVSGFARPNLSLNIRHVETRAQKDARVKAIIEQHKTGIIYCATRKKVDLVAELLESWNVSCISYHGGMSDAERNLAQEKFIQREVDIAIATNAFGMGIDRADVRFVIHYEVPGSIEAYYQEAGRAGRDGQPSTCELLFNYADTRTQEFFIDGANPSIADIHGIYQYLLNEANTDYEIHRSIEEIAKGGGIKNSMAVGNALLLLARAGYLERFDLPKSRVRATRLLQPQVLTSQLRLDTRALDEKNHRDRKKLKAMVAMCDARQCRQSHILEYFGERAKAPCGKCDRCLSSKQGHAKLPEKEQAMIIRKALSGVARMSSRNTHGWVARFGRARIAQMLAGSRTQEVLSAGLDQLTTHGILKEQGIDFINRLLRAMLDAGLVHTETIRDFPLLTLTPLGDQVMREKAEAAIVWPSSEEPKKSAKSTPAAAIDETLFTLLRNERSRLAKRDGMPAYVIFTNRALESMAAHLPDTNAQACQLHGISEAKMERYGAGFIEIIGLWKTQKS